MLCHQNLRFFLTVLFLSLLFTNSTLSAQEARVGWSQMNLPFSWSSRSSESPGMTRYDSSRGLDSSESRFQQISFEADQFDPVSYGYSAQPEMGDPLQETPKFDPALVSSGQTAFERSCLDCHDAARSYEKSKSFSGWMATIRRMATKDGANIAGHDFNAIATYLASRTSTGPGAADLDGATAETPDVTFNATVSTLWRGAETNSALESPGFFPDIWLGADWQPQGPLSAKVMTCTSCHSDGGFTFELVEATATLDLLKAYCPNPSPDGDDEHSGWEARIKAGRFVVPFGAFAGMSHPGSYRTLSNPMMYDMGRDMFFAGGPFVTPIVMQPYSDEGAQFSIKVPLGDEWNATGDFYAINGLRDGSISFFSSRSYRDNNREPATGGRVTFGNSSLRVGASLMQGNSGGDAPGSKLNYRAAGADLTARIGRRLRLYGEYAMREHDAFTMMGDDDFYGYIAEGEVFLTESSKLSLLLRYDTLNMKYDGIFTSGSVKRWTWGFNYVLPGGSLILIHHERWNPEPGDGHVDLVGTRWTATF